MADELTQNVIVSPGGYISKIQFNNDESIDIKQNDIVIFVGPNNTGKSQALKDIYDISDVKKSSIVIKDIEIVKRTTDLDRLLDNIALAEDRGTFKVYSGFGFGFSTLSINNFEQQKYYGAARSLFLTF